MPFTHARALTLALATAVIAVLTGAQPARAEPVTISVPTQFRDTSGALVSAHGGGMLKVGGYYYWFGEARHPNFSFRAVAVYRSTDLRTWEFRGNALSQSSAPELNSANIERPKVMFNQATGQYVMWMHKETATDYSQARAAVATSNSIEGPYTYRGSFRPFNQHMSRDITVFVDDDGAGYMVSSANENADLHLYRLTADYTNVAQLVHAWRGNHREAPALFKRNGVYFIVTSGATGWSPNQQRYSTSTSLSGPWSSWQNVGDGTAYGSQTTFVLPVQGSQTTSYLYLGDRWGPGFGGSYDDSSYVWLPLRFPTATSLGLDWAPSITVDTATGVVTGGTGGGSFVSLVARHSGKCADLQNGSTATNTPVVQWSCNGGGNQQFQLRDVGGGYVQLVARHSGHCLDVANVSTADGGQVIQWTCGSGNNQQWAVQDAGSGYVRLVARHSGKCLDVANASTADGARLVQWSCNGGTNQQWSRR